MTVPGKHEYQPKAHVNLEARAFEVRWACRHCWPEPDKGYVIRIFDSAEAAQQFADELNARHPYPGVDDKPGTANEPPGPQAPAGGNEKEK